MIRFALDGAEDGPGYVLIATVELADKTMPALFSGVLKEERAIAVQARELADAAAALIENIPEYEAAFNFLHDAMDALPPQEPPDPSDGEPADMQEIEAHFGSRPA